MPVWTPKSLLYGVIDVVLLWLVVCSVDPFVKKEWYDVKTPIMFNGDQRLIGKTPVTKTAGKSELLAA